jgi:hypothetical protein
MSRHSINVAKAMLLLVLAVGIGSVYASDESWYISIHQTPGTLCGAIGGLAAGAGCAGTATTVFADHYLVTTAAFSWRGSSILHEVVAFGLEWGVLPFTGTFAIVAYRIYGPLALAAPRQENHQPTEIVGLCFAEDTCAKPQS